MAETSSPDDWRRKHSLLALWQDGMASGLRDTSLLSLAVADEGENPSLPERGAAADAVCGPEPSGEVTDPRPDDASAPPATGPSGDPAFSPWQPANGSATHPEPAVPGGQMDEIGESLREVRTELDLLKERRARRYF